MKDLENTATCAGEISLWAAIRIGENDQISTGGFTRDAFEAAAGHGLLQNCL
jgi:hypothetical protein